MALAATRPYKYQSKNDPDFHLGTIAVTGTATVDLGIRHPNFTVTPSIQGVLADLAPGHLVAWSKVIGSPGKFIITVAKYNAGTWIAATVPVNVSFIAHVGNPV